MIAIARLDRANPYSRAPMTDLRAPEYRATRFSRVVMVNYATGAGAVTSCILWKRNTCCAVDSRNRS
jgi:hypothetical protein